MGKIDYGFKIPDRIARLANCYVGGRPLKSLLVGNPYTNSIEAFKVDDFKGEVIKKEKDVWFQNKLFDEIVALSYSDEKQIVCAGLEDGKVLIIDLNGVLKNEIPAQIDVGSRLQRLVSLEYQLLVACDCGTVRFVGYDKEVRQMAQLTVKGLTNVEVLNEKILVIETHSSILLYRIADLHLPADQIEPALKIKENLWGKMHQPVTVLRKKDHTLLGYSCENEVFFYNIPLQF